MLLILSLGVFIHTTHAQEQDIVIKVDFRVVGLSATDVRGLFYDSNGEEWTREVQTLWFKRPENRSLAFLHFEKDKRDRNQLKVRIVTQRKKTD